MDIHVELQTALTAMRREQIAREVAAAQVARQARLARADGRMPRGGWAALRRQAAALAQALVPRTMATPAT